MRRRRGTAAERSAQMSDRGGTLTATGGVGVATTQRVVLDSTTTWTVVSESFSVVEPWRGTSNSAARAALRPTRSRLTLADSRNGGPTSRRAQNPGMPSASTISATSSRPFGTTSSMQPSNRCGQNQQSARPPSSFDSARCSGSTAIKLAAAMTLHRSSTTRSVGDPASTYHFLNTSPPATPSVELRYECACRAKRFRSSPPT